jgi:transaldolase
MHPTTIKQIHDLGQSIWLDSIDRKMLRTGQLKDLIVKQGIRGITSNPAIFEKAINQSNDYREDIQRLSVSEKSTEEIFYSLAISDIREAADLFRPLYEEGIKGSDGYVSLEVSPGLARDTAGTIEQALRLWKAVARPNVMIKIPGTKEGLPAIRECIRQGLNINVTLLFGLRRYKEVVDAYLSGLEDRVKDNQSLEGIASVASFFLSRIDVLVDPMLEEKGHPELKGEIAIASAKEAYQIYEDIFASERFLALKAGGATPQRLLWASTGTKDPAYSDIKYVEALIAPHTVDTVPMETLEAYLDHGDPRPRLENNMEKAAEQLHLLKDTGIDLESITYRLEVEGIEKFRQPYNKMLEAIEKQRQKAF